MTNDTVDTRTCRERQDEAIDRLVAQADLVAEVSQFLLSEMTSLRARVAALEAATVAVPILGSVDSATGAVTWTGQPPEVRP